MTFRVNRARCTFCDLLTPVEQQLLLHPHFSCTQHDHREAHGFPAPTVHAALARRLERRRAQHEHLNQIQARMRDPIAELEQQIDRATVAQLDTDLRAMMRWLDDRARDVCKPALWGSPLREGSSIPHGCGLSTAIDATTHDGLSTPRQG